MVAGGPDAMLFSFRHSHNTQRTLVIVRRMSIFGLKNPGAQPVSH